MPSALFLWPGAWLRKLFVKNVEEGAPITISNILMAVTLLLINNIIFDAQGERGLFFWSICLQMLLVSIVFINGVMEALFAIGGVMVGEHDLRGFSLLARKSLLTAGVLVLLMMVLMWIPDVVGIMFGIEEAQELAALNQVLRIFSLLLLPFALTLTLVAVYLVLERMVLSVVIIVGQLAMLVLIVWLFATNVPDYVWYAFPLAAFLFLGAQVVYSYVSSRRQNCRVSGLTLIPYSEGGHLLDCSVQYHLEDVSTALNEIVAFLEEMKVEKEAVFDLHLCLEELMINIAKHSTGRVVHHSFDVHVFVKDQHVRVTLKDGGHPFDPIQAGHAAKNNLADSDDAKFGVYLAANIIKDISYKYMYGLNVVLIKI
ncbi:MAG: ATP-binding protein [Prevotella sp.]|nr:ATP-binding protein [Prevotella sp.]